MKHLQFRALAAYVNRLLVEEGMCDLLEEQIAADHDQRSEEAAIRLEADRWCPARPWSDSHLEWIDAELRARRFVRCMLGQDGYWSCEDCWCERCRRAVGEW
jgi:hypothetical protein